MAWTDQCRIAFNTTAEGLVHKNGGKGVVKILKQISKESDIPYGTLRRWYYPNEESVPKNGNKRKPSQEMAWKNVARRIESLNKYMVENCDPSGEIPEETREAVLRQADDIRLWHDSLLHRTDTMTVRKGGRGGTRQVWKKGKWQEA